jgi:hypothetical protein
MSSIIRYIARYTAKALVAALVAGLTLLYFVAFMFAIALVIVTHPLSADQASDAVTAAAEQPARLDAGGDAVIGIVEAPPIVQPNAEPEGDNLPLQSANLTEDSATQPTTDFLANTVVVDDPWQNPTAAPKRPSLRLVGTVHEFQPMPLLPPAAKPTALVDYASMTVAQLRQRCEEAGIEWRSGKGRKPLRKGELIQRLTHRAA